MFGIGNEYDIILELCSKDVRAYIEPFEDTYDDFFYLYIHVIKYLGVITHFTLFECEMLDKWLQT